MREMIHGIEFVASQAIHDKLNFELSGKLQRILGPEYVADFNQWSAKFFGLKYTFLSFEGKVFCSQAGWMHVKRKMNFKEVIEHCPGNGSETKTVRIR